MKRMTRMIALLLIVAGIASAQSNPPPWKRPGAKKVEDTRKVSPSDPAVQRVAWSATLCDQTSRSREKFAKRGREQLSKLKAEPLPCTDALVTRVTKCLEGTECDEEAREYQQIVALSDLPPWRRPR